MLSNIFRDAGVIVVVLPLMIFVHELGHFVAAKAFGVRVLTFSFGFGKRLFGVKPGDLIVQCDDLTNPNWEQLLLKIATSPNETLPIEIERGGKRLSLTITPQPNGNERTGYIGVRPVLPAVVQALETNMPAARAG